MRWTKCVKWIRMVRMLVLICAVAIMNLPSVPFGGQSDRVLAEDSAEPGVELTADLAALTEESLLSVPTTMDVDEGLLLDHLKLPASGVNGSEIVWHSSDETVMTAAGAVTRGAERVQVTLTATLSYGEQRAEKEFHFIVPGADEWVNGMPPMAELKQTADFTGEVPLLSDGAKISLTQKGGTATVENGALKLLRTIDGAEECSAYFVAPTAVSGDFVTEFTLTRDDNQPARVNMWGSANHFSLDWWADGTICTYYSDTKGVKGTEYTLSAANFQTFACAKITLLVSDARGTVSMWINNRPVFVEKYPYAVASSGALTVSGSTIYNIKPGFSGIYIQNYRTYIAENAQTTAGIAMAANALEKDSLLVIPPFDDGSIADNLNLPVVSENGVPVSWSSDQPQVISPQGKVTRPETRTEVVLTAAIGTGEYQTDKEFSFVVAGKDENWGIPQVIEMKNQNDFAVPVNNKSILALSNGDQGYAKDEHGSLRLMRKGTGRSTPNAIFTFAANTAAEVTTGTFAVEFTVTKDASAFFVMRLWDKDWKQAETIEWQPGGSNATLAGYSNGAWWKWGTAGQFDMRNNTLKFTLLFDAEKHSFSLWVNNRPAIWNQPLQDTGCAPNMIGVTLYHGLGNGNAAQNGVGTIEIDNYRYYTAAQEEDYYAWNNAAFAVTGERVSFSGIGRYSGKGVPASDAKVVLALKSGDALVGVDVATCDFSANTPTQLVLSCLRGEADCAELYLWRGMDLLPLREVQRYKLAQSGE